MDFFPADSSLTPRSLCPEPLSVQCFGVLKINSGHLCGLSVDCHFLPGSGGEWVAGRCEAVRRALLAASGRCKRGGNYSSHPPQPAGEDGVGCLRGAKAGEAERQSRRIEVSVCPGGPCLSRDESDFLGDPLPIQVLHGQLFQLTNFLEVTGWHVMLALEQMFKMSCERKTPFLLTVRNVKDEKISI
ncbi:uncharacterized protein M6D78_016009 [Vipera latastei]